MKKRIYLCILLIFSFYIKSLAEDGSRLWLRYDTVTSIPQIESDVDSPILQTAINELTSFWKGGKVSLQLMSDSKHYRLGRDGYSIITDEGVTRLGSSSEVGLLYATYHLLRLQKCDYDCSQLNIWEKPAFNVRILNHWDNLDGTVERGYAGNSLWQWDELPVTVSEKYVEYARANASIGINGTVLNNVNASPEILSLDNLNKVKRLADIFRSYGIKVYLSVNFASPIVLGGLTTADPLDPNVIKWWENKVHEVYSIIPDFGGFLVKANSEGQPGPCDYHRTHAQGANMLASAIKPYGGIIMWRAFVYNPTDDDRAKQAYTEFKPLDGQFLDNVIVQVKNGPIDFQPREPYSPLFGAMKHTPLMIEFQVTQEYLGHSNHLVYLAPMWREFYSFVSPSTIKATAGVANIGNDINWCGHDFAQSNWYAFGRLSWNPSLTSQEIAKEWLEQTFTTNRDFVIPMTEMMMDSYETAVDYMMPLGLHHLFAWGHHYGPEPWFEMPDLRKDWLPSYYHQADKNGIGFDRTTMGSNAVSQYPDSLFTIFNSIETCPEKFLLWFHHVPWKYKMKSGNTLWQELCFYYQRGVNNVRKFREIWERMFPYVDYERHEAVAHRLDIQISDAIWWKDGCLEYFRTFSRMKYPRGVDRPVFKLKKLKKIKLPIDIYQCPSADILPQAE